MTQTLAENTQNITLLPLGVYVNTKDSSNRRSSFRMQTIYKTEFYNPNLTVLLECMNVMSSEGGCGMEHQNVRYVKNWKCLQQITSDLWNSKSRQNYIKITYQITTNICQHLLFIKCFGQLGHLEVNAIYSRFGKSFIKGNEFSFFYIKGNNNS